MKYNSMLIVVGLLVSLGAFAEPTGQKVKAYLAQNGGDPANFGRDVTILGRANTPNQIVRWEVPNLPQPPDAYWDTLTDAEAKEILRDYRQGEKPGRLQAAENRLVAQARADAIIGPADTQVTSEQYQAKIDELLDNVQTPANDSQIARYMALKASVELAGGTVDDAKYVETP